MEGKRSIKGLGEIALQVRDLDTMTDFYERVVNLELMRRFPAASFFRISAGVDGHTQVLALFDRRGVDGYQPYQPGFRTPPLDHLAFGISLADYDRERERLRNFGLDLTETTHGWVGWRSLYVQDPEGNQVEWVCYDETVLDEAG